MAESVTDAEGVERQFDPLWTTPIAVMNRLDELGFIKRSINEARIGQLILVSGYMQILDIRMLKELWPTVLTEAKKQAEAVQHGSRQPRKASGKSTTVDAEIKAMSEGLRHLPHSLQMHLLTNEGILWATLNPDQMIVSAEDFLLKHGSAVPGEWYLLCVVDSFAPMNAIPIWGDLPISDLAKAMMGAAEQIRIQFGRPSGTVAVTPLSIFRAISPTSAAAEGDS